MERAGVNSLYDLSKWDQRGDWAGWDFHGVPARLSLQQSMLEDLLEDAAPVNRTMKDRWGWGQTGVYTTAAGYRALQASRNSSQTPAFWKNVWEPLAIPKVNFFFWTLVHNKLLTGDNLEKRNIVGPHRCVLCSNNSETAQHLFMDCIFAKEVWGLISTGLSDYNPSPEFCCGTLCLLESYLPPANSLQIILAQNLDSDPQICMLAALVGTQSVDFQRGAALPVASSCKS
jgi:hypothetical protein